MEQYCNFDQVDGGMAGAIVVLDKEDELPTSMKVTEVFRKYI